MKGRKLSWVVVVLAAALSRAWGIEVVKNDKLELNVNGRAQMIGVAENVPDPVRDNNRIYLFLKQARIGFTGRWDIVDFETQFAFGGENANGTNTDLGMLDFVANVPIKPWGEGVGVKVGQFRVPYGREGLTDRGYMSFGERSIANMAYYQSRDYGVALQAHRGTFAGTVGVFSAGGRDVPQRYLPERLGWPEMVARVGYNDGVDKDIYHVVGTDLDLKRTTKAAYLNALFMQDTLIGHNTVLNLRTIDKNLLIDSNYNQYIGAGPNRANGTAQTLSRGKIWLVGGDFVIRHPLTDRKALEAEAQVDWGGYENAYGALHIAAGRLQGAYRVGAWQTSVRYAALLMDRQANLRSNGNYFSPAMGSAVHEVTPSITWHWKAHNVKLVADAPVYLNMPVFEENGVGSYVFADQPGQVTYIASGGRVRRRIVPEARLMFQFMF